MSVTIALKRPISAHGEELAELVLREPTTKEIIATGLPTLVIPSESGDTGVEIRQKVVARYVVQLAGVPLSSVESLHPADWGACQQAVMGFFS